MPYSKTQQLIDYIRAQISTGAWPSGHRLPPRSQLMREHKVSITVVRDAQKHLLVTGELVSAPGVGYFVPDRPPEG